MSVVPGTRPEVREPRAAHDDRHSRALAALRAAEQEPPRSMRPAIPAPAIPAPAIPAPAIPAPAGPPLGTVRTESPKTRVVPEIPAETPARTVHPALAPLLPGGLPSGGILTVQGSTSLLLALLATASRDGAWVAFVGAPAVGMLAAADVGISLERTAVVPAPGPDAPAVLAALLDGMDVLVVGPRAALADVDRRRLAARTRQRDAVLVTTERWPGAHVVLDARGGAWSGADAGAGWLRRRTLSVLRTGRGAAARPVEIDVEVPVCGDLPSPAEDVGPRLAVGRDLRVA
ncbi:hypothetical protein GCM10009718_00780 [Isoptericola halotolerans]|uniref:Protein RecA n=1 Tax=Isoptericola halotolerans TaxID=300560 RepID=A0ABX2A642_9MICO|nr:hypothetical protein [Isoptericola halotolerans]NOV98288.1 hypothetical protein [Isoptericola halotolerans]